MSEFELPDDLETFADRVYWIVALIPEGRVVTYGQVATWAGSARAARAVGNLMRDSGAQGVEVPWQRVINASGRISLKGDLERPRVQRALLELEGVKFDRNGSCRLVDLRWNPGTVFWMDE